MEEGSAGVLPSLIVDDIAFEIDAPYILLFLLVVCFLTDEINRFNVRQQLSAALQMAYQSMYENKGPVDLVCMALCAAAHSTDRVYSEPACGGGIRIVVLHRAVDDGRCR